MGDGVNIAARLQGEAEPGGICISQTVYDVVKNRVGIQTVYLGPRELKNIREAVPVYQIILAAHEKGGGAESSAPWYKRSRRPMFIGAAAAVLACAAVAWVLLRPGGGGPAPALAPNTPRGQAAASQPAAPSDAEAQRLALLQARDFAGLAEWAKRHPELAKGPDGRSLAESYEQVAAMTAWFREEVASRDESRPLVAMFPSREGGL